MTDAAGFSQDRITIVGVDRSKKTIQHLSETFNVDRVPTFIVLKGGKEIGRVVEWGKYGMFDKELGEIISGAAKKWIVNSELVVWDFEEVYIEPLVIGPATFLFIWTFKEV